MYTNWGITLYDGLYGEAPPESGSTTFFMLQVGISLLAEVLSLDNAYFLLQCIICFVGLLMASSQARLYITRQTSLDCCVRICWRLREGIDTTSWIKNKKNIVREPHLCKVMAFQLSVYPSQYSSDLEIGTRIKFSARDCKNHCRRKSENRKTRSPNLNQCWIVMRFHPLVENYLVYESWCVQGHFGVWRWVLLWT